MNERDFASAKGFADLADLPENERIRLIAQTAAAGQVCAFIVEDDPKADRYIAKLAKYPVRIIDRSAGPVKGTVAVRVGPKES